MGLLPPGDERLPEQAAQRLAAEETQAARPRREAEYLLRPRRPQPLEVDRQLRRVEILTRRRRGKLVGGQGWRGRLQRRNSLPVQGPQPAVLAPDHLLNGRFPAKRAAAAVLQRPAAEIDHVRLAGLRFDEVGMTGALQFGVRAMPRAEDG